MEDKIFLKNYILTLESLNKYINILVDNNLNDNSVILKKHIIGYTNFNYPIYNIIAGSGKKDVVLIGGTHGCEIASVYFMLELLFTFLYDKSLDKTLFSKYTFHVIPVLNPEGFKISTSILRENFKNKTLEEIENISKIYVRAYAQDDENAIKGYNQYKLYKNVLKSSVNYIFDSQMRKSIINILNDCNLDERVLPIWSSNGIGIDPNANSIHKFEMIQKYRIKHKYGKLRYNDIPAYKPSPIGYHGFDKLNKKCPETLSIFNYITKLYENNLNKNSQRKLVSIFSYHLTGGEIYSTPDTNASKNQIKLHEMCTKEYAKYTNYYSVNDKLKYGFMDYFRLNLEGVLSLTVELSKISGNPISCFTNFENFKQEIINNKKAFFNTLSYLEKFVQNLD